MRMKVFKVALLTLVCSQTVWAEHCGRDYSSQQNNYAGPSSIPFEPPLHDVFYSLDEDGVISAWGEVDTTPSNILPPTGSGFVSIYSTPLNYLALKPDGSFVVWGQNNDLVADAPTDSGYVSIASTYDNYAAMKADGSITVWGDNQGVIDNTPTDNGYVSIERFGSNNFLAMREDGSFVMWGEEADDYRYVTAPSGPGFIQVATTGWGFAALHEDGHIEAWGNDNAGGSGEPLDDGYVALVTSDNNFTAIRADGSLVTWGPMDNFRSFAPTDAGYTFVVGNDDAFAALKADGSITAWGSSESGGTGAPIDSGYTAIVTSSEVFAATKADGSIVTWGSYYFGGYGEPTGTGYSRITASDHGFAALDANGGIVTWGGHGHLNPGFDDVAAPTDTGYIDIFTTQHSFVAVKADGSVTVFGNTSQPSQTGATGKAILEVNGTRVGLERTRCIPEYTVDPIDLVRRAIDGEDSGLSAQALNDIEGVSGAISGFETFYIFNLRTGSFIDYTNPSAVEIQDAINAAHWRVNQQAVGALNVGVEGSGSVGFYWLLLLAPAIRRFRKTPHTG